MHPEIIVGRLDVAELVFYAFVGFFVALVFYLRREDRREGYPLEDAVTGRVDSAWGPLTASTYKRFKLPFDRGYATTPSQGREPVELVGAKPFARFPGAPYVPTGDPLVDGVGPAAWVKRADYPDQDMEGRLRIVPLSSDDHWSIAREDPNLVGMTVTGADYKVAGTITDVWIDRSDHLVRYVDVALEGGGRTVQVPFLMGTVKRSRRQFHVDAISAEQFGRAPVLATAGQITRREEDQLVGYFGGGYLYGLPGRTEPLL
ncbi:photosynthetic reaction center subunit H [Sphingomonas glaciei]|uniref:Photosynthetic reaction center subunit H n=1 Tax=Sphingomonas glaciei TaxID=2938948 RepID=A0ABY5MVF5_9SPHN|nr:photosynthetic reaction center subunit H [Sphingomonas glaciei]UUR07964.1 photosynthetic reaction center subunit H [Sphingomonas glaciei]